MSAKGSTFTIRGSVADKMLEFFEGNPDEELTMEDIRTKFGASISNAYNAVERNTHVLEYVHVVRLKSKGQAS